MACCEGCFHPKSVNQQGASQSRELALGPTSPHDVGQDAVSAAAVFQTNSMSEQPAAAITAQPILGAEHTAPDTSASSAMQEKTIPSSTKASELQKPSMLEPEPSEPTPSLPPQKEVERVRKETIVIQTNKAKSSPEGTVGPSEDLFAAVWAGDVEGVKALLGEMEGRAERVRFLPRWNSSPLHLACRRHHAAMVHALLGSSSCAHLTRELDGEGVSCLARVNASLVGLLERAERQRGAEALLTAWEGDAAVKEAMAVRGMLLAAHARDVRVDFRAVCAAPVGSFPELTLQALQDAAQRHGVGLTLDPEAAAGEAVQRLFPKRSDLFRFRELLRGDPPLQAAVASPAPALLALHDILSAALLRGAATSLSVFDAAWERVREAMGEEAAMRVTGWRGRGLLHEAAGAGRAEVVKTLLARKAEATEQDEDGRTALHLASEKGAGEVVGLLLDAATASAKQADSEKRTPLHVWNFRVGELRYLERLAAASDGATVDAQGRAALHVCAQRGSGEAMACLAASLPGFDVNLLQGGRAQCFLFDVVAGGGAVPEGVQANMSKAAAARASRRTQTRGGSASLLAAEAANWGVLRELRRLGEDTSWQDERQRTAADVVCGSERADAEVAAWAWEELRKAGRWPPRVTAACARKLGAMFEGAAKEERGGRLLVETEVKAGEEEATERLLKAGADATRALVAAMATKVWTELGIEAAGRLVALAVKHGGSVNARTKLLLAQGHTTQVQETAVAEEERVKTKPIDAEEREADTEQFWARRKLGQVQDGEEGASALSVALHRKAPKVVELLCARGATGEARERCLLHLIGTAPVRVQGQKGEAAERWARAAASLAKSVSGRLSVGAGAQIVRVAARKGYTEAAQALATTAKVEGGEKEGWRAALMEAAKRGAAAVVQTLMQRGVMGGAEEADGGSVVELAMRSGSTDTMVAAVRGMIGRRGCDEVAGDVVQRLRGRREAFDRLLREGAERARARSKAWCAQCVHRRGASKSGLERLQSGFRCDDCDSWLRACCTRLLSMPVRFAGVEVEVEQAVRQRLKYLASAAATTERRVGRAAAKETRTALKAAAGPRLQEGKMEDWFGGDSVLWLVAVLDVIERESTGGRWSTGVGVGAAELLLAGVSCGDSAMVAKAQERMSESGGGAAMKALEELLAMMPKQAVTKLRGFGKKVGPEAELGALEFVASSGEPGIVRQLAAVKTTTIEERARGLLVLLKAVPATESTDSAHAERTRLAKELAESWSAAMSPDEGMQAVRLAVRKGYREAAEAVATKVKVEGGGGAPWRAVLGEAVRANESGVVAALLSAGVEAGSKDERGMSVLDSVGPRQRQAGAALCNALPNGSVEALQCAARVGCAESFRRHWEGLSSELQTEHAEGLVLLSCAVRGGSEEIMNALLAAASTDTLARVVSVGSEEKGRAGRPALLVAMECGGRSGVHRLLSHFQSLHDVSTVRILERACALNMLEVVQQLVSVLSRTQGSDQTTSAPDPVLLSCLSSVEEVQLAVLQAAPAKIWHSPDTFQALAAVAHLGPGKVAVLRNAPLSSVDARELTALLRTLTGTATTVIPILSASSVAEGLTRHRSALSAAAHDCLQNVCAPDCKLLKEAVETLPREALEGTGKHAVDSIENAGCVPKLRGVESTNGLVLRGLMAWGTPGEIGREALQKMFSVAVTRKHDALACVVLCRLLTEDVGEEGPELGEWETDALELVVRMGCRRAAQLLLIGWWKTLRSGAGLEAGALLLLSSLTAGNMLVCKTWDSLVEADGGRGPMWREVMEVVGLRLRKPKFGEADEAKLASEDMEEKEEEETEKEATPAPSGVLLSRLLVGLHAPFRPDLAPGGDNEVAQGAWMACTSVLRNPEPSYAAQLLETARNATALIVLRRRAVDTLGVLVRRCASGELDTGAVGAAAVELSADGNSQIRAAAVGVIRDCLLLVRSDSPDAAKLQPALLRRLQDSEGLVRVAALKALGALLSNSHEIHRRWRRLDQEGHGSGTESSVHPVREEEESVQEDPDKQDGGENKDKMVLDPDETGVNSLCDALRCSAADAETVIAIWKTPEEAFACQTVRRVLSTRSEGFLADEFALSALIQWLPSCTVSSKVLSVVGAVGVLCPPTAVEAACRAIASTVLIPDRGFGPKVASTGLDVVRKLLQTRWPSNPGPAVTRSMNESLRTVLTHVEGDTPRLKGSALVSALDLLGPMVGKLDGDEERVMAVLLSYSRSGVLQTRRAALTSLLALVTARPYCRSKVIAAAGDTLKGGTGARVSCDVISFLGDAAGGLEGEQTRQAVRRLMDGAEHDSVRAMCVRAAGKQVSRGDNWGRDVALKGAEDASWLVRVASAEALGRVCAPGDDDATRAVRGLAGDDRLEVVVAAVRALSELLPGGGQEAVEEAVIGLARRARMGDDVVSKRDLCVPSLALTRLSDWAAAALQDWHSVLWSEFRWDGRFVHEEWLPRECKWEPFRAEGESRWEWDGTMVNTDEGPYSKWLASQRCPVQPKVKVSRSQSDKGVQFLPAERLWQPELSSKVTAGNKERGGILVKPVKKSDVDAQELMWTTQSRMAFIKLNEEATTRDARYARETARGLATKGRVGQERSCAAAPAPSALTAGHDPGSAACRFRTCACVDADSNTHALSASMGQLSGSQRAVNFAGLALGTAGLTTLLDKGALRAVTTLQLPSAALDATAGPLLTRLLPQLTLLDVDHNELGDEGVSSMAAGMETCTALTSLSLSHNGAKDWGVIAVAQRLPACTALTHLGIGGSGWEAPVEVSLTRAVLAANKQGRLSSLVLASETIDISAVTSKCVCSPELWKGEDLWGRGLSAPARPPRLLALVTERLRGGGELTVLDLSGERLYDDGVMQVAGALKQHRGLKQLRFADVRMGDEGLLGLVEILERNVQRGYAGGELTLMDIAGNECSNQWVLYRLAAVSRLLPALQHLQIARARPMDVAWLLSAEKVHFPPADKREAVVMSGLLCGNQGVTSLKVAGAGWAPGLRLALLCHMPNLQHLSISAAANETQWHESCIALFRARKTVGSEAAGEKESFSGVLALDGAFVETLPLYVLGIEGLTKIDVSNNPLLSGLPISEICAVPALTELDCQKCMMLSFPPPEIAVLGAKRTMQFVREVQSGGVENTAMLLVMIGDGEAGKTSSINALTSRSDASMPIHEDNRTVGINIREWHVPASDDGGAIQFSILDLAGQAVYAQTHQFFLVRRAVYVLVWRARPLQKAELRADLDAIKSMVEHWMRALQHRVPGASCLLVVTHIDCTTPDLVQKQCDHVQEVVLDVLAYQHRASAFTNIPPLRVLHSGQSQRINCLAGTGVAALRSDVLRFARELSWYGERWPAGYAKLKERVMALDKAGTTYLSWQEYAEEGKQCGLEGQELVIATNFLHGTGALHYFGGENQEAEGGGAGMTDWTVFINKQWMVGALKGIIRHDRDALLRFFNAEMQSGSKEARLMCRRVQRLMTHGYLHAQLIPFLWPQADESKAFWTETLTNNKEEAELWGGTPMVASLADYVKILELLASFDIIVAVYTSSSQGGAMQRTSSAKSNANDSNNTKPHALHKGWKDTEEFAAPGLMVTGKTKAADIRTYSADDTPFWATFTFPSLPAGAFARLVARRWNLSSHAELSATAAAFYKHGMKLQLLQREVVEFGEQRTQVTIRTSTKANLDSMIKTVQELAGFYPGLPTLAVEQPTLKELAAIREPFHTVLQSAQDVLRLKGYYGSGKAIKRNSWALLLRKLSSGGVEVPAGTIVKVIRQTAEGQRRSPRLSEQHLVVFGGLRVESRLALPILPAEKKDGSKLLKVFGFLQNRWSLRQVGGSNASGSRFWVLLTSDASGALEPHRCAYERNDADAPRSTELSSRDNIQEFSAEAFDLLQSVKVSRSSVQKGDLVLELGSTVIWRVDAVADKPGQAPAAAKILSEQIVEVSSPVECGLSARAQEPRGAGRILKSSKDLCRVLLRQDPPPLRCKNCESDTEGIGYACKECAEKLHVSVSLCEPCYVALCAGTITHPHPPPAFTRSSPDLCPGVPDNFEDRLKGGELVRDTTRKGLVRSILEVDAAFETYADIAAKNPIRTNPRGNREGLVAVRSLLCLDDPGQGHGKPKPWYEHGRRFLRVEAPRTPQQGAKDLMQFRARGGNALRVVFEESVSAGPTLSAFKDGGPDSNPDVNPIHQYSPEAFRLLQKLQVSSSGVKPDHFVLAVGGTDLLCAAKVFDAYDCMVPEDGISGAAARRGRIPRVAIQASMLQSVEVVRGTRLRTEPATTTPTPIVPFPELPAVEVAALPADPPGAELFKVLATAMEAEGISVAWKTERCPAEGRILLLGVDEAVGRSAWCARELARFSQQGSVIPLILPGYQLTNFSRWWPDTLPMLQDHALFVNCSQPTTWTPKIKNELMPQVNRFLEEWRGSGGQAASLAGKLRQSIPCSVCVEEEAQEPATFDREETLRKVEEAKKNRWLAAQGGHAGQGGGGAGGAGVADGVIGTCWRGHEVDLSSLLWSGTIQEAVPCPACVQAGAPQPFCFRRSECLSFFAEADDSRSGVLPCPECRRAGRPPVVRIMDIVSPEVFISYNWGHWEEGDGVEPGYSTQKVVRRFRAHVEQMADVVCWFDVAGGMGAGQDLIQEMREGIRRCTVVLAFLSDAYLNSANCKREMAYALAGHKFVIPVLIPGYTVPNRPHSSGWTGPEGAGAGAGDWWMHADRACDDSRCPDDARWRIQWSLLGQFTPIDLRACGVEVAEAEAVRQVLSRFYRDHRITHRKPRPLPGDLPSYQQWTDAGSALLGMLQTQDGDAWREGLEAQGKAMWRRLVGEASAEADATKQRLAGAEELRQALLTVGVEVSLEQTGRMLREADLDGDGQLDEGEFLELLLSFATHQRADA